VLISVNSHFSVFKVVFENTNRASAVSGFMDHTVNTLKVKIIENKVFSERQIDSLIIRFSNSFIKFRAF